MNRTIATATRETAPVLIRISVGLIFVTQGILKYIDPNLGVLRFTKIGFPFPDFTAHFVGTFEIVCGLCVTFGVLTRLTCIPLLIVMVTAIATTKIPELFHPGQGFWSMVSDGKTDFALLTEIIFLLLVGAGRWSLDEKFPKRTASPES